MNHDEAATLLSTSPSPSSQLPTREVLAGRILQHQEETRGDVGARRRVGMTVPTETEVAAVLTARRAAADRAHETMLQNDVARTHVMALRCYDLSLDDGGERAFEVPAHLSDVQVRQDLVRPVHKLIAILALRLRLSNVLKILTEARDGGHKNASHAAGDAFAIGGDDVGSIPLPSAALLPPLSTLLHELPLPSIACCAQLACGAAEHVSAQLFDVPRCRPCHDAFVFRLRHFMPVGMPGFALDVAAQAERETQTTTTTAVAEEAATVPTMEAPLPSPSLPADAVAGDSDNSDVAVALTPSVARVMSDTRDGPNFRAAVDGKTIGDGDAEAFLPVLLSHTRSGYGSILAQPQSL